MSRRLEPSLKRKSTARRSFAVAFAARPRYSQGRWKVEVKEGEFEETVRTPRTALVSSLLRRTATYQRMAPSERSFPS